MRRGAAHVSAKRCDRSTPKGLVHLLPTLSAFGYIHLGNWNEFRSQVPLIGPIPDATSPDHTEFQDALSPRPRWCRKGATDGKTRATPLAHIFH